MRRLRDESCSGLVRRAYVRQQGGGRQRWVVIGEFCDGCETFWPLRDKRVRPVQPVWHAPIPESTGPAAEPEAPPEGGPGAAPASDTGFEEYDALLRRFFDELQ